jgi:hypothetical protein
MSLIYPTASEIRAVEREREPNLTKNRPIFSIMPIVEEDTPVVRWEQEDNIRGLQQLRGLGGKPAVVKGIGGKVYTVEPGIYGEKRNLDEVELTMRRQWGTTDKPVDVSDLVMKASEQLQARFLDRVEYVGWNALMGTFTILGQNGSVLHSDTFTVQTASAAVAWGTFATAKPLFDFREIKLKARGKGATFGRGAKAYMNTAEVNKLLSNLNANDLFGKKDQNQSTLSGLADINKILVNGDCPEIVEYDGGYEDDAGDWQTFIPDGKVIVVGNRYTGTPIGDYCMVRNVNNPNMESGQYTKVVDNGETEVPREIAVHNGHNGAPRIRFASNVCVLTTT